MISELEYINECNLCKSRNIDPLDATCNIFICNECGYVFDNPRPTLKEIEKFYSRENQYELWLKDEKARDILWKRRLKMVRKYKNMGTLLDIGSGTGQFLHFAEKIFEVEGTEISEIAINIAREKYDLNLKKGLIEDIDFGKKQFDIITLFHVLEHATDPCGMIENCYKLLREKGVIIIAVPNEFNLLKVIQSKLFSRLKSEKIKKYGKFGIPKIELDGTMSEIHLSHFTSKSLEKFLTSKNFTIVEETLDPYYVAEGINKFFQRTIYLFFLVLKKLLRRNLYKTIWIAALKNRDLLAGSGI